MVERVEITKEWVDNNFNRSYPDGIKSVFPESGQWNIGCPVHLSYSGGYRFYLAITTPQEGYNEENEICRIKYVDQLESFIKLFKDCNE